MRVYVAPHPKHLSRSIHRLADALTIYAPKVVEVVDTFEKADLILCHVIGWTGWPQLWDLFAQHGKQYAIWQHCLKTSEKVHPHEWAERWQRAEVVASCYDLAGEWAADPKTAALMTPNFFRSPLGVDTSVFYPRTDAGELFNVGTSGYVAEQESVQHVANAVGGVGGRVFHLGPNLRLNNCSVTYRNGITDDELASYWSRCRYVSGLRVTEAFELPAYEGLCCGVRPIMFDREDARHWLGDHAEYVIEHPDPVFMVREIDRILRGPYREVTADEIAWAREMFSWKHVAEALWLQLLPLPGGARG